jgi:ubiquinone/menaquinone biosynthesis C-methylase UbiE
MTKLNLGCCENYMKGLINIDSNKNVKADLYLDITKKWPFKDNSVEYILADNILEHITKEEVEKVMKEMHRVCKDKAIIEIYTPHFTSVNATKLLCHKTCFGIGTFSYYESKDTLAGDYSKINFKILKEELRWALRGYQNFKGADVLNAFNFIFNWSKSWQLLMERFWWGGFDEIKFILQVEK